MPLCSRRALLVSLFAVRLTAQNRRLRGRWAARVGGQEIFGTWTARDQADQTAAHGTWALLNASGEAVASGTWAARKLPDGWRGSWSARTANDRVISGEWSAGTGLPPSSGFFALVESALKELVSGTWRSGGASGTWSIRAEEK